MFKIRWILIPIWLHFGTVLGPKSEPNWYKIALNITAQDEHQTKTLSDRLKIDFWSILASDLGPKSGQDLATWSQDRPKMFKIGANMSPRPLTGNEDGPKTPPRSLMGPILVDFGVQFNDFWVHVGRFWTPVNEKEVNTSST